MIFTAYFDEADTHGPEPTIIMAAFLGHAYQWRRFEIKLARIQAKYGFRIFHAKDFKAKAGEFSQWPDEKCALLVGELTDLVRDNLTEGVAVHLEYARYVNEYRAAPIPRKMALDSQYGVCFRSCLGYMLGVMQARQYRDRLNVVLESGHRNAGDCLRIFEDFKRRWRLTGDDVLGTFTVSDKRECLPLMAADMFAAALSMMRANTASGKFDPRPYIYAEKPRRIAPLVVLELTPDALRELKDKFEEERRLAAEVWRATRAARHLSLGRAGE